MRYSIGLDIMPPTVEVVLVTQNARLHHDVGEVHTFHMDNLVGLDYLLEGYCALRPRYLGYSGCDRWAPYHLARGSASMQKFMDGVVEVHHLRSKPQVDTIKQRFGIAASKFCVMAALFAAIPMV